MGKAPAFQFYPGDWTRDLDDQDLEVEGAWIRICCRLWWSETKGQATKPIREWARILRKTEKKTREIFQILLEKGIASGSILDNQNVTIISRRMVRDSEISEIRKRVGKLGGNPALQKPQTNLDNQTDNQKPTPSSSSSSSSSNKEKYPLAFESDWTDYPGSNKGSKEKGFEVWKKRKDKPPPGKIREIWKAQIRGRRARAQVKEFTPEWPMFTTYFNQARWEEEFKPSAQVQAARDDPWVCKGCGKKVSSISNGLCLKCQDIELSKIGNSLVKGMT